MKNLFRFTILLAFGIRAAGAFPQSVDDYPEADLMQYTPAPQTWSMVRFGNTPVDYYTGTAQADIPVYTYSDPDFQFSISAGYASNGFLPQRQTGILGLNWFLNCGGVVTREIRGVDDFVDPGNGVRGFLCGSSSYPDADLEHFRIGELHVNGTYRYGPEEVNADIFHFSFMGFSGTFHHDGRRNIKVCNTGGKHGTYDIVIQDAVGNGAQSKIAITTEDGFVYTFGGSRQALEYTIDGNFEGVGRFRVSRNSASAHVVSWLLTSVTAPNGRTMSFSYDAPASLLTGYLDENTDSPYYVTSFAFGDNRIADPDSPGMFTEHYRRAGIVRTSYLTGVDIDGSARVELSYSRKNCRDYEDTASARPARDVKIAQNLYKLDSIRVFGGQRLLRKCGFSYRIRNQRLILDAVDIAGLGRYSMSYCEDFAYPGINTADVDFWGYYNGKQNAYDYISGTDIAAGGQNEYIARPYKDPDFNYGVTGCLKRIEYPTKGYTEFEYEANRARYVVMNRDKPVLDPGDDGEKPVDPIAPLPVIPYVPGLNNYSVLYGDRDETGGVRIRKITDYDGLNGYRVREYRYTNDGGASSGIVLYFPRSCKYRSGGVTVKYPLVQPPCNTFDKSHIGYSTVREIYADSSCTKYEFNDYRAYPDDFRMQPVNRISGSYPGLGDDAYMSNILREPNSFHLRRGKLHTRTLYDARGGKVACERMLYNDCDTAYSVYIVPSGDKMYAVRRYTDDYRLVGKVNTDYFGTRAVTVSTAYSYNRLGQLSCIGVRDADNVRKTYVEYLHETPHGFGSLIFPKQYQSRVVRTAASLPLTGTEHIVAASKTSYRDSGGGLVEPSVFSRAEIAQPVTAGQAAVLNMALTYRDKLFYEKYDRRGNPLQVRNAAGECTCFIWGYGGLYPVARVRNATYGQIGAALAYTGDVPLAGALTAGQAGRLYAIGNAHVDIYDYLPYVGLIRHVDPSGRSYTYEYDLYGRLTGIRDQQGVVETYEYHL